MPRPSAPAATEERAAAQAGAAEACRRAAEAIDVSDYVRADALLGQLPSTSACAELSRIRLAYLRGEYGDAEQRARKLAHKASHALAARTWLGRALIAVGAHEDAVRELAPAAKDPRGHAARLLLGRLWMERGQPARAAPHFAALIADYNNDVIGQDDAEGLALVAMAARALHSYHDANDAFAMSARVDPERTGTQLEWARLFLEKGDIAQAAECAQVALKYAPHHPGAHALWARVMLERGIDFPTVEQELEAALAVNPRLVEAHVARAGMALRNMQTEVADTHLVTALAVNPNDLEALSMRVAVRFLADDAAGQAEAEGAVLARNPRYARMYSIVGKYAEWEHRYDDLVAMAKKALALDREAPEAHAMLALNLLRTGREAEGRAELQAAWERDRFNVRVYNMLNLYEQAIDPNYEQFDAPPFVVRLNRAERNVLEPYLVPMLRDAYGRMVKHYHYEPDGPLHIELFAEAEEFSVRTTGLPNIGVQGVCFGKLITAISPAAGAFNWGQILWHELSHVFHLQLSKNHVPRWFTEGLAEYETVIARPEWRREEDHNLWLSRRRGELPKLSELNAAFTEARSPDALMTAYYAASLAVTHLVERFGFERVTPMLQGWGHGKRTPAVFRDVLGIELADADASFERFVDARLSKYAGEFYVDMKQYQDLEARQAAVRAAPGDADAQAALAVAYLAQQDPAAAEKAGLAALSLSQQHPVAHFALALVYLARGEIKRTYGCLSAIVRHGHDGYELRLMLMRAARDLERSDEAIAHALAAAERDPDREDAWQALVELSEGRRNRPLAERALRELVRIDQHGRIPHMALMVVLSRKQAWDEVRDLGERTLYLHPASAELHRLLAESYLHTGAPERALASFDQALTLRHRRPGLIQLGRAKALSALGRRKAAESALTEALRADPDMQGQVERFRRTL